MKEKKMSLEEMVRKIDDSKKVNPLDLSSDQDLSIALMNLVSLEEHFFFSGAKTKKPGFYDLINVVRNMRKELMERIVDKNKHDGAEVWCISKHLLAASMRLYEVGTKALGAGNKSDAYKMFEKAYELYSLFWGLKHPITKEPCKYTPTRLSRRIFFDRSTKSSIKLSVCSNSIYFSSTNPDLY